jgi:hypothetical protein
MILATNSSHHAILQTAVALYAKHGEIVYSRCEEPIAVLCGIAIGKVKVRTIATKAY